MLSCDELPRNALGKVQHFRLKELIAQGSAPASAPPQTTDGKSDANSRPGRWQWLVGRGR